MPIESKLGANTIWSEQGDTEVVYVPEIGVIVTRTGTDAQPNFDFLFCSIKGEKGDKGDKGDTGDPGDPSSLIDDSKKTTSNAWSAYKVWNEIAYVQLGIPVISASPEPPLSLSGRTGDLWIQRDANYTIVSIWRRGNTDWVEYNLPEELPAVTSADNGKLLGVVNGAWGAISIPQAEGSEF